MKITPVNDPTPTLGDREPFYSCYYEDVPAEFRLEKLIKPDFERFPRTYMMIEDLVMAANDEFAGWEIMGRTFKDFARRVRSTYRAGAARLEKYISKFEEFDVVLSTITKTTVGAGKTVVTDDTNNTTERKNTRTFGNQDKYDSTVNLEVSEKGTSHDKTTTEVVNSDVETESGPVGMNPEGSQGVYRPSTKGKTDSKSKTTSETNGDTTHDITKHETIVDDTTKHTGTIGDEGRDELHIKGKNTTETDERITSTEVITPGVAIEELAKIKGIETIEEYFIEMMKPCFTLYRWYNW